MKTAQEHFTTTNGTTTRHATYADALSSAMDAFNLGHDVTVWSDTVQVYEHNDADIARARESVRANALDILRACAGK